MKRPTIISFAVFTSILLLFPPFDAGAQEGQKQVGTITDDILDEGPLSPRREEAPEDFGAPVPPEDLEMMEEGPAAQTPQFPPREAPALPAVEGGEAGAGEEARQVVIDALVNMNYIFNNSPDSFVIKYHLHFEGRVAASTAVVKGNSSIATEVTGYLAKWPTGECKLSVQVPSTQTELTFRKVSDDKATIDLKFTNPISEIWESQCLFKDAPDATFNTKGDPEKWLAKALEKARPPLARMSVDLNPEESTTMKFEIGKQTIKDPPLGSAEVDGTGVITVNPGAGG